MAAPRSPSRTSKPPEPERQTRASLTAYAEECDIELIFLDPPETYDPAIIGLIYGAGQALTVLYDEALVLAGLVRAGMNDEEAREWFEFNTVGAFLGDATPRFLLLPEPR